MTFPASRPAGDRPATPGGVRGDTDRRQLGPLGSVIRDGATLRLTLPAGGRSLVPPEKRPTDSVSASMPAQLVQFPAMGRSRSRTPSAHREVLHAPDTVPTARLVGSPLARATGRRRA